MKKVFFASVLFLFSLSFVFSQVVKDGDEPLSPFVGTWRWVEDNDEHNFAVLVGEHNDTLFFAMGGVFEYGKKEHFPIFDMDFIYIADVRVKKKDTKIVRSKVHTTSSSYKFPNSSEFKYNDVSFELLNDTTMLFILDDGFPYWPDTALLIHRDRINYKFSPEEGRYLYKGEE